MLYSLLQQILRAFTWFVEVAPWEQALRVRLGRHIRKLNAGIYFRIPFIDRVFKQSIRRRINVLRAQTVTTSDRHVVTCASAVGYSIGDLEKLYDTLECPNDTIENEISAIVSEFIGSRTLSECGAVELEKFVMDRINLAEYGLEGQEFYVTSFATCKTLRIISGEMSSWSRDSQLVMNPPQSNGPPS